MHLPIPRQEHGPRWILWIAAVVLMFAGLANHVRVSACVGECCADLIAEDIAKDMVAAEQAMATPAAAADDGCSCCYHGEPGDPAGEQAYGTCDPGCCVTIEFDVEWAPAGPSTDRQTDSGACATIPPRLASGLEPLERHQARNGRPIDRGPPRVDRSTALRACTVLLI